LIGRYTDVKIRFYITAVQYILKTGFDTD